MLHVRNGGDGPAHQVRVAIDQPDSLIYVPNSTTVNDVPVRDTGALPPFAAGQGIVLKDVDPGVEATIAWRTRGTQRIACGHGDRVHRTRYVTTANAKMRSLRRRLACAPSRSSPTRFRGCLSDSTAFSGRLSAASSARLLSIVT